MAVWKHHRGIIAARGASHTMLYLGTAICITQGVKSRHLLSKPQFFSKNLCYCTYTFWSNSNRASRIFSETQKNLTNAFRAAKLKVGRICNLIALSYTFPKAASHLSRTEIYVWRRRNLQRIECTCNRHDRNGGSLVTQCPLGSILLLEAGVRILELEEKKTTNMREIQIAERTRGRATASCSE